MKGAHTKDPPTGDELVGVLAALANPTRLRIVAVLAGGRDYVSHLAREIGISRPLLHMHLQRLEEVGLIVGSLELSLDGKAMKYFEVADFDLHLTAPALVDGGPDPHPLGPGKGPETLGENHMESWTWPQVILILGLALVAFMIFIGVISTVVEYRKVKIGSDQVEDLRKLVQRYEQLAEKTLDAQQRTAVDVAELRSRASSIEQILRTVE